MKICTPHIFTLLNYFELLWSQHIHKTHSASNQLFPVLDVFWRDARRQLGEYRQPLEFSLNCLSILLSNTSIGVFLPPSSSSQKSRQKDRSKDRPVAGGPGAGRPSDPRNQATVSKLNVIEATMILSFPILLSFLSYFVNQIVD